MSDDPNKLFADMERHPSIAPVFELLDLADGSDEASLALKLARDCFSSNQTLRVLSRRKLRQIMRARIALVTQFEVAVATAARRHTGQQPASFKEAMAMLPREQFDALRDDYEKQANALKSRPLMAEE